MGLLHPGRKAKAHGEILSALTDTGHGVVDPTGGYTRKTRVTVRVVPDDGSPPFESHLVTHFTLLPGRWTFVRYNPKEPDECEIDTGRLKDTKGRSFMDPTFSCPPGQTSTIPVGPPTVDALIAAAQAQQGDAAGDPLDRLKKLGELRASGVLTDDEFEEQKRKILEG